MVIFAKTKRLELILPADHEIFTYPSGSRRTIAAKYLDIGMQLSRIETKIDSIENYIADVTPVEVSRKGNTKPVDKAKITRNIIQGFGID